MVRRLDYNGRMVFGIVGGILGLYTLIGQVDYARSVSRQIFDESSRANLPREEFLQKFDQYRKENYPKMFMTGALTLGLLGIAGHAAFSSMRDERKLLREIREHNSNLLN